MIEVVQREFEHLNKKTYIVLISGIYHVFKRSHHKALWRHLDKLLLRHFDEIKNQSGGSRESFIVARAYIFNDLATLNPGVLELISELMKNNIA